MSSLKSGVAMAIKAAGGQSALGRLLGCSQGTVWCWLNRDEKIPPQHVLKIEETLAISRHVLRPDIFGPPDTKAA